MGNLNSDIYIGEILEPKVFPFFQVIPGTIFEQNNSLPHVANNVQEFFLAENIQLLSWPAYSPDISSNVYMWDFIKKTISDGMFLFCLFLIVTYLIHIN